jgi:protein involved in polysaccharide export with SLBB domain
VRARLFLLGVLLAPGCAGLFSTPESTRLTPRAGQLAQSQPYPVALPRELDKHLSNPYVVEPGDVLLIQPADYDSPLRLPGDQPVLPDGTINLGKFGRIVAAGKTLDELEALVKQHLQSAGEKEPPTVVARLVTRQSKVYYVLGEVNAPGAFVLTGRETVLDAILQAGGLNDRAAPDRILLARPTRPCAPRVVVPVCYTDIAQMADTSTNYQVQAGDRIFVPARASCAGVHKNTQPCLPCGKEQRPAILPAEPCVPGCPAPGVMAQPAQVASFASIPTVVTVYPAGSVGSGSKKPEQLLSPPKENKKPAEEKMPGDDTSR